MMRGKMSESIKPSHKNRKKKAVLLVLVLLLVHGAGGFVLSKSPRVRLLLSVVHFSETPLKSPEYLLYNIDIMELFRDYGNGDVQISGQAAYLYSLEKLDWREIREDTSSFVQRVLDKL